MVQFSDTNLQVLATLSGNAYLLPGASEPEWLYRRAEHARILARETAPALREAGEAGLVARLKLVFGRG